MRVRPHSLIPVIMLPVLVVTACGDPTTEPDPPTVPKPVAIALSPPEATLSFIGETAVFAATVTDQYGAPFDASVSWSGDADGVFSVASSASASASAVAKAIANGSGTITASFMELSATASVTVAQVPTTALVSSGADQEALPGASLAEPVFVEVSDRGGTPVPGLAVRFTPNDNHGSVDPDSTDTDSSGQASTLWTLGSKVGPQILTASVPDGPRLRVTATGSYGSAIEIVAGRRQRALPGAVLREPIVVRVLNKRQRPVAGTTVLFTPEPSHGSVNSDTVTTDEAGEAAVVWTLGDSVGTQSLNASVPFGPSIPITATGLTGVGVCDRTPEVRDALVSATNRRHCSEVTSHQLARITSFPPRSPFWIGVTHLYEDDFAGLTGLDSLNLGPRRLDDSTPWFQLSELPPRVFSDLRSLKSLTLSHHNLETLPESVFSPLTQLEHLSLSGNPITHLPIRVFRDLTNLQSLELTIGPDASSSLFQGLSSSASPAETGDGSSATMSPLAALQEYGSLDAWREAMQAKALPRAPEPPALARVTNPSTGSFPAGLFTALVRLRDLSIETGFSTFPPDALHGATSLRSLRINGPTDIPDGLLSGFSDLENLWLLVSAVETNGLRGLTALRKLNLEVSDIAPGAFRDLASLERLWLYISGSKASLPPDLLSPLSHLSFLTIGGTQLEELPRLSHLTVLKGLSLWRIPVPTIEAHNIPASPKLTTLFIRDTRIGQIPARVFANAPQLDVIGLHNNRNLTRLDPLAFAGLGKLRYIQIFSNKVRALPTGVFSDLRELRIVWLDRERELEVIAEGALSDLLSLEQLAFTLEPLALTSGGNKLTSLPEDAFANLPKLRLLWFHHYPIADLPPDAFAGKPELRTLRFEHNRITRLHPGVFLGPAKLTDVRFCGNPGAAFPLHVSLMRTDTDALSAPGPASIVVGVKEGAPFDLALELSASSGSLSADTTTVPAGALVSDAITVTASAGDTTGVVLSMEILPSSTFFHWCYHIPARGPRYLGIYPKLGDPITLFR